MVTQVKLLKGNGCTGEAVNSIYKVFSTKDL